MKATRHSLFVIFGITVFAASCSTGKIKSIDNSNKTQLTNTSTPITSSYSSKFARSTNRAPAAAHISCGRESATSAEEKAFFKQQDENCKNMTDCDSGKQTNAGICNAVEYNTMTNNYCGCLDWESADSNLNDAYQKLVAHVKKEDKSYNDDYQQLVRETKAKGEPTTYITSPISVFKSLRDAQRIWITYRDAQCKSETDVVWTYGTGRGVIEAGCKSRMTKIRTKELVKLLGEATTEH